MATPGSAASLPTATVPAEWNRLYHDLLQTFRARTGIAVLLNTFNRRGMPLVETPEEALRFFLERDLDGLVLASYVLRQPARLCLGRDGQIACRRGGREWGRKRGRWD